MTKEIAKMTIDRNSLASKSASKEITRSNLIEIIARVIGEYDAPDHVPEQWQQEAADILSALSAAGLAVVADDASPKTCIHATDAVVKEGIFVGAGDMRAIYRAMVAAEDLTG